MQFYAMIRALFFSLSLSLSPLPSDHMQLLRIWLLVGGFSPSEKDSSIGMMTFPIYGKIKAMFQTTNQIIMPRLL